MIRPAWAIAASVLLLGSLAILVGVSRERKTSMVLRLGFPANWGTTVPALQFTAYGDAILFNQFRPLLNLNSAGVLEPLSAQKWEVTSDFRGFTFYLDPTQRFSDGTLVTAASFKSAWEMGLKLKPLSKNSSVLDVFYRLEGFSSFKKTGKLGGVKVIGDHTLELRFSEPFRMALDYLSGTRFAVFKVDSAGRTLGSGPYLIEELGPGELRMTKNPHWMFSEESYSEIRVSVIPPDKALAAFSDGRIDAYSFANFIEFDRSARTDELKLDLITGPESGHLALEVNGNKGRIFSDAKMRRAFQALVHSSLKADLLPASYQTQAFQSDPQPYLRVQLGRLADEVASEIIFQGKKDIPELIERSKKSPIFFATMDREPWLQQMLEASGLQFDSRSGWMKVDERIRQLYHDPQADIYLDTFSVANGDPDGIYHAVGKNGAIHAPCTFRSVSASLLEEGRSIIDRSPLDPHYQKVSRAILEEVPFVHLGFRRTTLLFSKERVGTRSRTFNRSDIGLDILYPRK